MAPSPPLRAKRDTPLSKKRVVKDEYDRRPTAKTIRTYPLAMDCATSNYPRVIHPHETWYFLQDMYKEVRAEFGQTWKESLNQHGTGMQVPFEIRDDGPRGRTIHVLQDVPKGQKVWKSTHFGTFKSEQGLVAFLKRLPHGLQCDVLLWAYPEKGSDSVGLALDEGSYMNHGESKDIVNMDSHCSALRRIKAGEEVLEDYGEFIGTSEVQWFDKLRAKAWGEQKKTRVGDAKVEKQYVSLGVPKAGAVSQMAAQQHAQAVPTIGAGDMDITDMIMALELETSRHSFAMKMSVAFLAVALILARSCMCRTKAVLKKN